MRNLLVLTLLLSFVAKAEFPAGRLAATAFIAGSAAMSAVTTAYGDKARRQLNENDGDSGVSVQSSRLLMSTEVFSGIGAGLLALAIPGIWFKDQTLVVSAAFSAVAAVLGSVELITSSIAFGLEDNHEYTFPDGISKKGSSDPNLKIAFGTSIANPFAGIISLICALALRA